MTCICMCIAMVFAAVAVVVVVVVVVIGPDLGHPALVELRKCIKPLLTVCLHCCCWMCVYVSVVHCVVSLYCCSTSFLRQVEQLMLATIIFSTSLIISTTFIVIALFFFLLCDKRQIFHHYLGCTITLIPFVCVCVCVCVYIYIYIHTHKILFSSFSHCITLKCHLYKSLVVYLYCTSVLEKLMQSKNK